MSRDHLFEEFLEVMAGVKVQLWFCPVQHPWVGKLAQTVEWDGDVACCLWPGCWRRSDDPVPRGECLCEEYVCAGECCGAGRCSCSEQEH
jgi:hypothetical protein